MPRSPAASPRPGCGAPSRPRCSRPPAGRSAGRRRSGSGPAGSSGRRSGSSAAPVSPTLPVARSAASSLRSSSSLRKRTWVEMSGRVTPSVPLSPQQRLLSSTLADQRLSLHRRLCTRSSGSGAPAASSGCGRGRGTGSRRCRRSVMPFSSRYSWMSMMRQPGKMSSNL